MVALVFAGGLVVGAVVGGLIARNNPAKAKAALDKLVTAYEAEKAKLSEEIKAKYEAEVNDLKAKFEAEKEALLKKVKPSK